MQPVVARRWTWAIGGASLLGQLVVGSLGRAPSWDEAIYLSQVTRGAHALPFVASRARGITVLVAPLASVGTPLWALRLFLAVTSTVLLVVVFRLWVPVVGSAAVVGAGLFAASWPALFYGTEVMPNLWAALLALGVTGCFVRTATRGAAVELRHAGACLALAAAAMALMRPSDAVVLGLALTARGARAAVASEMAHHAVARRRRGHAALDRRDEPPLRWTARGIRQGGVPLASRS